MRDFGESLIFAGGLLLIIIIGYPFLINIIKELEVSTMLASIAAITIILGIFIIVFEDIKIKLSNSKDHNPLKRDRPR